MSTLSFIRWDTIVSDCAGLYFVGLQLNGALEFVVEDEKRNRFVFVFDGDAPFRVVEEQYLSNVYWSKMDRGIGWTFTTPLPPWTNDLTLLDIYEPDAQHYVVATYDCCLEILSARDPLIRRA